MDRMKAFWTGTGLSALMAVMAGCDSGERIQEPAGAAPAIGAQGITDSSDFDRDLIAAKTANADPDRREQAIRSVLDKYGVPYSRAYPAAYPAGTADGTASIGMAAAKAAFTSASWNPVRRDFSGGNDIHTFSMSVFVDQGQTLGIAVIGNSASVDPFVVASYKDGINNDAYPVRVIGFNDDASSANRNSVLGWTNNTGRWQIIDIVAFSFASSTRGQAFVSVAVNGAAQNLYNREIGGMHLYGATPLPTAPTNCFPNSTYLWLQNPSGPMLGTALVIDTKAMRGGSITLTATTPLPLALPWIVDNPYPSFALVYNPEFGELSPNWPQNETPYTWELIQKDHYTCVR